MKLRRRRNLRLIASVGLLLTTVLTYQAWRSGWLPVEIADAETGQLVPIDPETGEPLPETDSGPSAPSADVPGFLSLQDEPSELSVAEPARLGASDTLPGRLQPVSSVPRLSRIPDSEPAANFSSQATPFANPSSTGQAGSRPGGRPNPAGSFRQAAYQQSTAGDPGDSEKPEPPAQPVASLDPAFLAQIDSMIEQGQDIAAHRELSKLYWKQPELRPVIQDRIERTAHSIYLSPQPHYLEPYEVQPGDQLRLIAKRYEVPWEYLALLNRVDPKKIRVGQKLKVIKGPFSAVVDLSEFQLTIHAHGYFVHSYPVGIGKDGTSPIGRFKVQEKLANPTYYGPDGVIAADHPDNPLGEYWIGIGNSYGIHGTIDPDSIGKAESKGCIRLRAQDIGEVYQLLDAGSEVIIRR